MNRPSTPLAGCQSRPRRTLFFALAGIGAAAALWFAGRAGAADPPAAAPDAESKATLLGIEGHGKKVVYVFDRSGSMGSPDNKPLNRAKKELLTSIDGLTESQQFYIIFYNEQQKLFQIDPTGRRLIFANDQNKKLARQFVDGIGAGGGTRHYDALAMALRLQPDVVFMLTDGDPIDDLTADELARIEQRNAGTVFNVIQVSAPPEKGENRLVKLAEHTRGTHKYVDFSAK